MLTGKPEVMREVNKTLILETIRKQGAISRTNLQKMINLSFPAVSSIVNVLLEEGWILETEKDNNTVGRKAMLLQYNGKKGYVVGVDIGRSHLTVLLSNLLGEIIAEDAIHKKWKNSGQLMEDLIRLIYELLDKESGAKDKIMCISAGMPGIRDEKTHKNILVPFLEDWETVDVQEILSREFQTTVLLDNSVNLGAIGEKWRGRGKRCFHMLYLDLGVGVGSAMILNGELYRGMNGAAGEIGYSLPQYSLARDSFLETGVFESIASGYEDSGYKELPKTHGNMKEIFRLAKEGKEEARRVLERIFQYTAVVLVNSVAILNPEMVIFAGSIGEALLDRFYDEFVEILKNHVPYVPELAVSNLGKKTNAIGAVGVALRSIHSGFSIND